jgi:hypothetical protein
MTIAQWYERVNAAWPNPRPPLTAEEAIRAAKRLYRFSRGRKWVGPVKITSGRRYTWIQYGTMILNPERGWKHLVHMLSHHAHMVLHPQERPHGRVHARLELRMIKEVIKRGWLNGKLKTQPNEERIAREKERAALAQSPNGKLAAVEAPQKRWTTKLKRATTALKKLELRTKRLPSWWGEKCRSALFRSWGPSAPGLCTEPQFSHEEVLHPRGEF